jgi:N-acetylglutamate synthase
MGPIRPSELEAMGHQAWPAKRETLLDGWRLRWASGYSNRANCVWAPQQLGRMPLKEKLAAVDEFYGSRGLPSRYQVSSVTAPASLEERLVRLGYALHDPSEFMALSLRESGPWVQPFKPDLIGNTNLYQAWYRHWGQFADATDHADRIGLDLLRLVKAPSYFVSARLDGRVVGVGRAVLQRDWLGIFNMATRAEYRGKGIGRSLLIALAAWGTEAGAVQSYLQVDSDNIAAKRLYLRMGYKSVHRYAYRIKNHDARLSE